MTPEPSERPDFAALYDENFAKVYNYVRCRLLDAAAADDVTSRVFERALDRLDGFDPSRGPAAAWLIGIASNAVADHYRERRWLSWLPFESLLAAPGRDPRAEDELAQGESRAELLGALGRLDERERELLALKYEAGMKNTEIAVRLGLSDGNVGVILYRAVKKLQAMLEEAP
ncbi:MAG: sigma-70 family RNA polymerase sigma factor [Elusimicrobia bacterium]|nr:sigma-70 family RNA polymerase sigma factor [Elusimicrobiota bacterium]